MTFQELKTLEERLQFMKQMAKRFFDRAAEIDENGDFPYENIKELVDAGYTKLIIPKEFGGEDISLYELVRLQEEIAIGDGSTALGIGWHMSVLKQVNETRPWKKETFEKVIAGVKEGRLINNCASEQETGSPTRGGKPTTTAKKTEDGWIINGRKTFTTLSPILYYFVVSATIEETGEVGNFLIERPQNGIEIEETWDSIAMKGTGSHDLVLNDVFVRDEHFLHIIDRKKKAANGSLLHIPACYLGIAEAAQKYAIQFAKEYTPNSVNVPIIELTNVREKIGEMELLIMEMKHFLYSVAKRWDQAAPEKRFELVPELGAVKISVTNKAIQVVDLAMRIVGARSLSLKNPLQRYYRDVRAGLHNPPMDDPTILLLADYASK